MNFSPIRKENPLNEISASLLWGTIWHYKPEGEGHSLSAPHGPVASVKVLSALASVDFHQSLVHLNQLLNEYMWNLNIHLEIIYCFILSKQSVFPLFAST